MAQLNHPGRKERAIVAAPLVFIFFNDFTEELSHMGLKIRTLCILFVHLQDPLLRGVSAPHAGAPSSQVECSLRGTPCLPAPGKWHWAPLEKALELLSGGENLPLSSCLPFLWEECRKQLGTKQRIVDKEKNVYVHEKFNPNYTSGSQWECEIMCPGCSSC